MRKKWLFYVELEETQSNLVDVCHGVEVSQRKEERFLGVAEDGRDIFIKDCRVVLEDAAKQSRVTSSKKD